MSLGDVVIYALTTALALVVLVCLAFAVAHAWCGLKRAARRIVTHCRYGR